MDVAKIQLSKEELLLVQNADVLLTKNRIIQKVYEMFGQLVPGIQQLLEKNESLSLEVSASSPKISRGENYLGLPYVMFDYPRLFSREDIFAIRTMFWWGNFFSVTLHLRGPHKTELASAIQQNISLFGKEDFFISINEDEWRHDFMEDNYVPVAKATSFVIYNGLYENDFCKLAVKTGFEKWNEMPDWILQKVQTILNGMDVSYRDGETGL